MSYTGHEKISRVATCCCGILSLLAYFFSLSAAHAATCELSAGSTVIAQGTQTMGYDSQMAKPSKANVYLVLDQTTGKWSFFRCNQYGKDEIIQGAGLVSANAPGKEPLAPSPASTSAFNPGYCRSDIMRNHMYNQTVCGPMANIHASLVQRAKQQIMAVAFMTEWKDQKVGQFQTAQLLLYVDGKGKWTAVVRHPDRGDIGVIWVVGTKMSVSQRVALPPVRVATGQKNAAYKTVSHLALIDASWTGANDRCQPDSEAFPLAASGTITGFNASNQRKAIQMFVHGRPNSSWRLEFGSDQCMKTVLAGSKLAFRDYSGARLAAGSVSPYLPSEGGAAQTCEDANAALTMVSSASGIASSRVTWCKPLSGLARELEKRGLLSAMSGMAREAATGRDVYFMVFADQRNGMFALVQVEPNGAAVVLAEGEQFSVVPSIINPLRQATAESTQLAQQRAREAEQRRIAQQKAAAEAARVAEAELAARRQAELRRLLELDKKGVSVVNVADVILNSTNAADAATYFDRWVRNYALSTAGRDLFGMGGGASREKDTIGGGKVAAECWKMFKSGGCLYTMNGKAVGVSYHYSGGDCFDCDGGVISIRNSALSQGFRRTSSTGPQDQSETVYQRGGLCMVENFIDWTTEERETDMFNRETSRWVKRHNRSGQIVVMTVALAQFLSSGKACRG